MKKKKEYLSTTISCQSLDVKLSSFNLVFTLYSRNQSYFFKDNILFRYFSKELETSRFYVMC